MLRVLIVDDHPVVREGLAAVLEGREGLEVVGQAGTVDEAVALAWRERADVALLDLELPGATGANIVEAVHCAAPETRLVVFTAYESDELVFGALKAGANGYLLKGAPADEIVRAIQVVHSGGTHLEPRIASRVVASFGTGRPAPCPLTPRENQVLKLVAEGMANKQIAGALHVSESTVKFHLRSLFGKLEADNRAQAVARAVQKGLL